MIDLHSHILPGVDDGVQSFEEARLLAREAVDEHVTAIAATPHVRYDLRISADEIDRGIDALRTDLAMQEIPVQILHGAEVELAYAARLAPEELAALSIARTGRYVLLEFPYRGWPVGLIPLISRLESFGMTPILGHPERNPSVQDHPESLEPAVEAGAVVQITARSLDGRFGRAPSATAKKLLALGLVRILASDAHGLVMGHGLAAAARSVGDPALAHYLTAQAPAAVVAGAPLPPLPGRGAA